MCQANCYVDRKCMILFSPLPPLILLLRPRMILMSNDYWTAVVNLLNGIGKHPCTRKTSISSRLIRCLSAFVADDIVCLSKLGLLSKHLGTRANDWAKCVFSPLISLLRDAYLISSSSPLIILLVVVAKQSLLASQKPKSAIQA